jgi:hypothetical protein
MPTIEDTIRDEKRDNVCIASGPRYVVKIKGKVIASVVDRRGAVPDIFVDENPIKSIGYIAEVAATLDKGFFKQTGETNAKLCSEKLLQILAHQICDQFLGLNYLIDEINKQKIYDDKVEKIDIDKVVEEIKKIMRI